MMGRTDEHEEDELRIYFEEIGRFPLLTRKREIELSERIKKDDNDAFIELVRSNLRLVVRIAKRYRGQGISFPDLIAEGNVGLVKAAERYDSSKSKFSSYSAWWIRQTIERAIHDKSRTIRLPVRKSEAVIRFKMNQLVSGKKGTIPSAREVSESINFPYDELKRLLALEEIASMDSPTVEDLSLSDSIEDAREDLEEEVLYKFFRRELSSILQSALDEREWDIVIKRFGLDNHGKYTLERLSKEYSLTRQGINHIEKKALRKLNDNPDIRRLVSYFG
jgi:RNA polymerase primary sigma factor